MHKYGVVSAWNRSLAKATAYSAVATTWMSKNYPVFRSKIDPWISLASSKLLIAFRFLSDLTAPAVEPVRAWLAKTIPPYLDHVRDSLVPLLISFTKDFTNAVLAVFLELGRWVQENVLVGNWSLDKISEAAADVAVRIQSASGHAASWFSKQVRALTN